MSSNWDLSRWRASENATSRGFSGAYSSSSKPWGGQSNQYNSFAKGSTTASIEAEEKETRAKLNQLRQANKSKRPSVTLVGFSPATFWNWKSILDAHFSITALLYFEDEASRTKAAAASSSSSTANNGSGGFYTSSFGGTRSMFGASRAAATPATTTETPRAVPSPLTKQRAAEASAFVECCVALHHLPHEDDIQNKEVEEGKDAAATDAETKDSGSVTVSTSSANSGMYGSRGGYSWNRSGGGSGFSSSAFNRKPFEGQRGTADAQPKAPPLPPRRDGWRGIFVLSVDEFILQTKLLEQTDIIVLEDDPNASAAALGRLVTVGFRLSKHIVYAPPLLRYVESPIFQAWMDALLNAVGKSTTTAATTSSSFSYGSFYGGGNKAEQDSAAIVPTPSQSILFLPLTAGQWERVSVGQMWADRVGAPLPSSDEVSTLWKEHFTSTKRPGSGGRSPRRGGAAGKSAGGDVTNLFSAAGAGMRGAVTGPIKKKEGGDASTTEAVPPVKLSELPMPPPATFCKEKTEIGMLQRLELTVFCPRHTLSNDLPRAALSFTPPPAPAAPVKATPSISKSNSSSRSSSSRSNVVPPAAPPAVPPALPSMLQMNGQDVLFGKLIPPSPRTLVTSAPPVLVEEGGEEKGKETATTELNTPSRSGAWLNHSAVAEAEEETDAQLLEEALQEHASEGGNGQEEKDVPRVVPRMPNEKDVLDVLGRSAFALLLSSLRWEVPYAVSATVLRRDSHTKLPLTITGQLFFITFVPLSREKRKALLLERHRLEKEREKEEAAKPKPTTSSTYTLFSGGQRSIKTTSNTANTQPLPPLPASTPLLITATFTLSIDPSMPLSQSLTAVGTTGVLQMADPFFPVARFKEVITPEVLQQREERRKELAKKREEAAAAKKAKKEKKEKEEKDKKRGAVVVSLFDDDANPFAGAESSSSSEKSNESSRQGSPDPLKSNDEVDEESGPRFLPRWSLTYFEATSSHAEASHKKESEEAAALVVEDLEEGKKMRRYQRKHHEDASVHSIGVSRPYVPKPKELQREIQLPPESHPTAVSWLLLREALCLSEEAELLRSLQTLQAKKTEEKSTRSNYSYGGGATRGYGNLYGKGARSGFGGGGSAGSGYQSAMSKAAASQQRFCVRDETKAKKWIQQSWVVEQVVQAARQSLLSSGGIAPVRGAGDSEEPAASNEREKGKPRA